MKECPFGFHLLGKPHVEIDRKQFSDDNVNMKEIEIVAQPLDEPDSAASVVDAAKAAFSNFQNIDD
jgi:hypothetical protein